MATNSNRYILAGKLGLFALALLPALLLIWAAFSQDLGPNPVETLQRKTGIWALNFLMFTLAVSPLREVAQWPWLGRFRRMLGLFAFFYGTLHLLSYVAFDHAFELAGIAQDIGDRRFITVGFAAWVLMIPLAATSVNRVIKALGGRRWQVLQRLVYGVGVLALTHYFWLSKGTALLWPIGYAIVLLLLFGWRIWKRF